MKYEGGISEWLQIPRHRCNNKQCQKIHRMLADFMVPFKHYSEEVISGVLDGVVLPSDEDSADYPSEQTMIRWHHWLMKNKLNIDGQLKSIAYRELDFSQELLKSSDSLLSYIRSFIPDGWFRTIIRFLYNSGNSLSSRASRLRLPTRS